MTAISGTSKYQAEPFLPRQRLKIAWILSPRAMALVACALYLLWFPAAEHTDIIAAAFSYSILGVLFLVVGITLVKGAALRRSTQLAVKALGAYHAGEGLVSNEPSRIAIQPLSSISVPPGFVLEYDLRFTREVLPTLIHQVTGRRDPSSMAEEEIIFPHRGVWQLETIAFRFGDQLGLSSERWTSLPASSSAFRVLPPLAHVSTLPVISSAQRVGAEVAEERERQGDLFDLKQYHPADGMKRIVWKVFARTGTLLARHPERAVTPEGQVVLFALADTMQDYVCSAMLSYTRKLEELDLDLIVGARGMESQAVARTSEAAEELCLTSAWHARILHCSAAQEELRSFVDTAARFSSAGGLERVLIFYGLDRLTNTHELAALCEYGAMLQKVSMRPVFVLVPEPAIPAARKVPRGWRNVMQKLFFDSEPVSMQRNRRFESEFRALCNRHGWEVLFA